MNKRRLPKSFEVRKKISNTRKQRIKEGKIKSPIFTKEHREKIKETREARGRGRGRLPNQIKKLIIK